MDNIPVFKSLYLGGEEPEEEQQQHHHFHDEPVWRSVQLDDEYEEEEALGASNTFNHKSLYLGQDSAAAPLEQQQQQRKQLDSKIELSAGIVGLAGDAVQQQQPGLLEIQEEPAWVEPWSSFLSESLPQDLLQEVARILERNEHADHEVAEGQARISGLVAAADGTCVKFQLRIYARKQGGLLAEVQRRRGCIVAFGAFYRSLVTMLGPDHVKCQLADADAAAAGEDAIAGNSSSGACDQGLGQWGVQTLDELPCFDLPPITTEAVQGICDMASSSEQDVAGEGLRALAGVSQRHCNLHVLAEHAKPIMALLETRLTKGGDCSRAASALLANLARSPDTGMKALLTSTLLGKILDTLDEPDTLDNKRVKRQVALALASLECSTHHTHIDEHRGRLQKCLELSSDPRLHHILNHTLGTAAE